MPSLHLFHKDNWDEVQHDAFIHLIHLVLALASCFAARIVNGMTAFISARQSNMRCSMTVWSCNVIGTSVDSHDVNGIIIGTNTFVRSRQLKLGKVSPFWSCDAIGVVTSIILMTSTMAQLCSLGQDHSKEVQHDILVMWNHLHWHKHHMIMMVSSMAPLQFLAQASQNKLQHDFLGHVTPLVSTLAPCDDNSII